MSEHTKGDWKSCGCMVALEGGCYLADLTCSVGQISNDELEANSCLIAAAPDLLEACKQAEDYLRSHIVAINRPAKLDKLLMDAIAKGSVQTVGTANQK